MPVSRMNRVGHVSRLQSAPASRVVHVVTSAFLRLMPGVAKTWAPEWGLITQEARKSKLAQLLMSGPAVPTALAAGSPAPDAQSYDPMDMANLPPANVQDTVIDVNDSLKPDASSVAPTWVATSASASPPAASPAACEAEEQVASPIKKDARAGGIHWLEMVIEMTGDQAKLERAITTEVSGETPRPPAPPISITTAPPHHGHRTMAATTPPPHHHITITPPPQQPPPLRHQNHATTTIITPPPGPPPIIEFQGPPPPVAHQYQHHHTTKHRHDHRPCQPWSSRAMEGVTKHGHSAGGPSHQDVRR